MLRASIATGPMGGAADIRRARLPLVPLATWRAVAGAASGAIAWYVRQRQIARCMSALSQFSDRMLRDIGVERCDIPRIVRHGRDVAEPRW
jgi:uncharacterized protein YjiS (DUF1127 family)